MAELHGVSVTESALGASPIDLPDVSNIGIVGTAPGAAVAGKFGENGAIKYNHPFLITTRAQAAAAILGEDGTLPDALDGIFAQTRARVVMVIVENQETGTAVPDFNLTLDSPGSLSAGDFALADLNENNQAELTIQATASTTPNLATLNAIEIGQIITIRTGSHTTNGTYKVISKARPGTGGVDIDVEQVTAPVPALAVGTSYTLSVAAIDGPSTIRTNARGTLADRTGVYALMNAQSEVGVRPNLILAPDLNTGERISNAKNPLGAALEIVAGNLRAIALIAGPNGTHDEAIAFAGDYGDDRTYLIEPYVKVSKGSEIVNRDPTPYFAGVIVKNDASRQSGWASSPSNKLISGILGTARPIDYVSGDPNSHAQLLNNAGIATIINLGGGYRTWGNKSPASGDRVAWKFINVRRTADVLYKAIQDEHLWAVDQGITATYFEDVSEGVNAFIRGLISQRALIAGRCFPDQDLNTADNIALGRAYFNIEYTPIYPAESLNFKVSLTTEALDSLV